jgi:CBS domain-containing protein
MDIADIVSEEYVSFPPNATVSKLAGAFDDPGVVGVVTVDDVLTAVQPFLDAATVADAHSADLVTLDPDSTFGEALHVLRENRISHLPVVEDDSAVGILSLYDVIDLTVRPERGSRSARPSGIDSYGGDMSSGTGRSHGGFGAREGELARMLDLPVRDVMTSPVRTIHPDATLDTAVAEMFDIDASSLVVTRNGEPFRIVTKTDVLDSLTWEAGGSRSVQLYGADLIDDIQYDDIVTMVEKFDDRDAGMRVLDARIHFQKHDEKFRGTPLLLARIRLHTDRGLYIASGEGYGAKHALHEARDVIERRIRDRKTYGRSKKHPDEEYWEKRFGWLLEE